ncbi:phosphomannomutase [Halomonas sp. SpR8]|uniref:phosphomannomutase n=1 Tax=Halomonas sp. SpR8 TaxID=3050463 RepID=UPI0027E3EA0A|nr:phosphomannomutase [Halomonas sp. SpR8]MDQ7727290.1 phosphomannomutase [Halomonas sp. SpR8]
MSDSKTVAEIINDSGIAFGTSGARGLVEQLTDEACAAFTVGFIESLKGKFDTQRVALAIDRRPSSPRMAAACAGVAEALGLQVEYFGVLPTPALALYAMGQGIPAIMITGSHIPFDRNGIKFYRPDGEITKADEQAIVNISSKLPSFIAGLPSESKAAEQHYIKRYLDYFPADFLSGKRIGLYEHSAAGRDINAHVLKQLGADVVSLGRTESFVPIDTEAVSLEDQERGRVWSEKHQLDAIFSTDGDGDRPLVADENGEWLRGDLLGLICAQELGIEALAIPVSCNSAIELSGYFKEVARTRIGSPYVIEGMQALESRCSRIAGFEANGGFLTDDLPTRDALLPVLALLAAAARKQVTVSNLFSSLPERYTYSDRIQSIDMVKASNAIDRWTAQSQLLVEELQLGELGSVKHVNSTDGLRVIFALGDIVHIRPSGNAPELRCYTESSAIQNAIDLNRKCLAKMQCFC